MELCDPIDAVVFDFDGVLTDNRVLVMDDGREAVFCDRGDGLGLGMLKERGIPMLILSKEKNPVVSHRAKKLGIECLQGIDEKLPALKQWLATKKVRLEHTVYVGNDVNDLECMGACGTAVCPSDAHPAAKKAAAIVLSLQGGRGAVRELADVILFRVGKSKIP